MGPFTQERRRSRAWRERRSAQRPSGKRTRLGRHPPPPARRGAPERKGRGDRVCALMVSISGFASQTNRFSQ